MNDPCTACLNFEGVVSPAIVRCRSCGSSLCRRHYNDGEHVMCCEGCDREMTKKRACKGCDGTGGVSEPYIAKGATVPYMRWTVGSCGACLGSGEVDDFMPDSFYREGVR